MLLLRIGNVKWGFPTMPEMLTGSELLAKVKELGDAPKDKVCEACGYYRKREVVAKAANG